MTRCDGNTGNRKSHHHSQTRQRDISVSEGSDHLQDAYRNALYARARSHSRLASPVISHIQCMCTLDTSRSVRILGRN